MELATRGTNAGDGRLNRMDAEQEKPPPMLLWPFRRVMDALMRIANQPHAHSPTPSSFLPCHITHRRRNAALTPSIVLPGTFSLNCRAMGNGLGAEVWVIQIQTAEGITE